MKKLIYRSSFVLMTFLSACGHGDETVTPINTGSNIQSGTWKVSFFSDNGNDETNHFSGYEFTFNSSGTATASNGSSTVNGTWQTRTDDSQPKLDLNFGNTAPFDELNDDWHILQSSSSTVQLEDVSGGNGGTDLLTFTKVR